MLLSSVFIFGAASICCVALIGHIDVTAAADMGYWIFRNLEHKNVSLQKQNSNIN